MVHKYQGLFILEEYIDQNFTGYITRPVVYDVMLYCNVDGIRQLDNLIKCKCDS